MQSLVSFSFFPIKTRRLTNVVLMSFHCRRIARSSCLNDVMISGVQNDAVLITHHKNWHMVTSRNPLSTAERGSPHGETPVMCPVLGQCWPTADTLAHIYTVDWQWPVTGAVVIAHAQNGISEFWG